MTDKINVHVGNCNFASLGVVYEIGCPKGTQIALGLDSTYLEFSPDEARALAKLLYKAAHECANVHRAPPGCKDNRRKPHLPGYAELEELLSATPMTTDEIVLKYGCSKAPIRERLVKMTKGGTLGYLTVKTQNHRKGKYLFYTDASMKAAEKRITEIQSQFTKSLFGNKAKEI